MLYASPGQRATSKERPQREQLSAALTLRVLGEGGNIMLW